MQFGDLKNRYDDLQLIFQLSLTIDSEENLHAQRLTKYLDAALDEIVRILMDVEPDTPADVADKIAILKDPRTEKVKGRADIAARLEHLERSAAVNE